MLDIITGVFVRQEDAWKPANRMLVQFSAGKFEVKNKAFEDLRFPVIVLSQEGVKRLGVYANLFTMCAGRHRRPSFKEVVQYLQAIASSPQVSGKEQGLRAWGQPVPTGFLDPARAELQVLGKDGRPVQLVESTRVVPILLGKELRATKQEIYMPKGAGGQKRADARERAAGHSPAAKRARPGGMLPARRKAATQQQAICRNWQRSGTCPFAKRCIFMHACVRCKVVECYEKHPKHRVG